ncbi:MAG: excinuclease ABC subunit UvrA, partial [Chloroflexi bacterium]|nr:excinuclease ABC subunit UvrA [Chloroflexota bacterium]
GTVTEIYDYMRLLYARVGVPHCHICGREISRQTVQQMVDAMMALPEGARLLLLAPLIRDRKGEHRKVIDDLRKAGYVRVRVDGEVHGVDDDVKLDRYKNHTIEVVVDRLVVHHDDDPQKADGDRARMSDSVETALKLGDGVIVVSVLDASGAPGAEHTYSEKYACPACGISLPEFEPRSFSFNSPHGACPACTGLGFKLEIDPAKIVPDPQLSLEQGALEPWEKATQGDSYFIHLLQAVAQQYGFALSTPWSKLSDEIRHTVLHGSGNQMVRVHHTNQYGHARTYETTYEGIIPNLERRYKQTNSDYIRETIEQYMTANTCTVCQGKRLKPESLAVTVGGLSIYELSCKAISESMRFIERLEADWTDRERLIVAQIVKELLARLRFLQDVGLHYLTLDRSAVTLSGGEAQRIRLATQIGSQLMGVLYILDEPSIGLHQRDNQRLIDTLGRLRDLGNTVLVVEHDEETIRAADYVVDLGPGAGEHGGHVIFRGTLPELLASKESLTGRYLSGELSVPLPAQRRAGNGKSLTVRGAREHNLKNLDVRIPLGCFVAITGVSGSGKSTLLMEIVLKRLASELYRSSERPGAHDSIHGVHNLDKVVHIDQSPIGRTPRSNPATYAGVFDAIRGLFAAVPEAKVRGYEPGRFSFNVKGGRCEACQGAGIIRIEMQFLSDVYVPCEVCHGQRYNREALEIQYKGRTIAEVLDMTVDEALEFFQNLPMIANKLQTLHDVGLGYIRMGQPATTLSGGEAQRVKLAKELSRRATGRTFYVLDEPTVGLHADDVSRLLMVLQRLVDAGNTVVVIEHNLDVIKTADWIIDLGPEGGDAGGYLIAEGTPEQVAEVPASFTGQFLRKVLTPAVDGH